MSGSVADRKRLIRATAGDLDNRINVRRQRRALRTQCTQLPNKELTDGARNRRKVAFQL